MKIINIDINKYCRQYADLLYNRLCAINTWQNLIDPETEAKLMSDYYTRAMTEAKKL